MPRLTQPVTAQDHALGPASAPVTLVEYGDFECPHCGAAFPIIKQIQQALDGRLRFVYRHFPLTETHPHAQMAAEAAEAAGAQGSFWEMHNLLFQHQDRLEESGLIEYARELRLNEENFRRDLEEHTFTRLVEEEFIGGVRSGVNGTPTFFINAERYDGPADFDDLMAALREAADNL